MREYTIRYISNEGRDVSTTVEAEDEDSALEAFWRIDGQGLYSGDQCLRVIDIE